MSATLEPVACCAPLGAATLREEEALATAECSGRSVIRRACRIVNLLATRRRAGVRGRVRRAARASQPTVSHHLKKLTEAGLLDREPRGKFAYFTLNPDALRTLAAVVDLKGVCC